ncbi:MAG TPA: nitrite reductase (NAD(P)H), partial [Coleofasciculaceae cyanobacterium]
MTGKKNLIVIGNGMVGHKFLELMVSLGGTQDWNLITFCEEPRVAYDRVNLSGYFSGKTAADLSLVEPGFYQENGIEIHIGDKAIAINCEQQTVSSANGLTIT